MTTRLAVKKAPTIGKKNLAEHLAQRIGVSVDAAKDIVNAIFDEDGVLVQCFCAGETVSLPGFGTFKVVHLKGRVQFDGLHTKQTVFVPPHVKVRFANSSHLKRKVNEAIQLDDVD